MSKTWRDVTSNPSDSDSKAKINQYRFPLLIILAGVLFSLFLQSQLPNDVFFSGDAGLKALLAKQFSSGQFRFDLNLPVEDWVRNLWQSGLYPFQEPFVYNRFGQYFITFPFTFPLVTAPFQALFGYRGLYVVPLIATWAVWVSFYFACRRLKLNAFSTAIALAILIFASPLSIYSAMYWEHSLAVALCFHGMATLLIPGTEGLSKKDAVLSGIFIGLSVWFREEILGIVAFLAVLVYAASFLKLKKVQFLARRKELFVVSTFLTIAIFFVLNTLIYKHPLGMHSVQIVEKFSLVDRLLVAVANFNQMSSGLFEYFPLTLFAILYLGVSLFSRQKLKLSLGMTVIYAICFLFTVAVAVMVPAGAGGKQWGSRFLLVLVPLICLVAIKEFEFVRRLANRSIKKIGTVIFLVLFIIGVYKNTYSGTAYLSKNYQGISPAIQFLRSQPETVVAMSNQYVAQVLQAPLLEKVFFLTKEPQDLQTLGEALLEQKKEKFIYVCYYTRSCQISEKKPEEVKLPLKNQQFTMEFLPLGKYGNYPIFQASIGQRSPPAPASSSSAVPAFSNRR
ncbi:dolichol-phosphate mannosyltransferase [Coleofasciculus sp. FACHB-712]|uniref:LA_3751/LA_3752 family putative glycosyltransferase n=1 Tax=Coleofasciculus sp. FACHB-712 TaxID=2692789 RepID=UPI0018EFE2A2|nr:dolichol-phosphate mannosyltransferase [Coleofasciculus sp. FACHB-712]